MGIERQHVHDGNAAPSAVRFGDMIGFLRVHFAAVGEEQDGLQRAGRHEHHNLVFIAGGVSFHAPPATALSSERFRQHPFDVSPLGDADQHGFVRDEIFFVKVATGLRSDVGAALIAILFNHILEIFLDHAQDLFVAGQQIFQVADGLQDLALLVLDLLALKSSQAAQLHIQDRLSLSFA